jgi:hypothetical protein
MDLLYYIKLKEMFFGLDYTTMMYMAAAAATLAAMTFTYYFTKNGVPKLNLT